MAGHSHWAGIKHKKGRIDKEKSKIFSKLSREITVAAKLGDKNPDMNPRLRTAVQAAKQANMPKENISRAIRKSEMNEEKNYENLRYEGFGPFNTALIIETLTDNKNRSASNIRTILQKNGGRLGRIRKRKSICLIVAVLFIYLKVRSVIKFLKLAINLGAKDCFKTNRYHEIITDIEDFYKIKTELEKKIDNFVYSALEWRAVNYKNLNEEQRKKC